MDLSKISNDELHVRLTKLTASERKITHLILWHINEFETRRLYADLGFGSMYDYLTKQLGYGESSAYRRLQSARLLKQIPHLAEKLENGSLNLTQLTQVQKCLAQESGDRQQIDVQLAEQVLEKIENKSTFETQKILAQDFNLPIQRQELLKPQKDNSINLTTCLSEEQMRELQMAKNLLSHVLPNATWAEVITHLAKKHNEKVLGKNHLTNNSSTMGNPTIHAEEDTCAEDTLISEEKSQSQSQSQSQKTSPSGQDPQQNLLIENKSTQRFGAKQARKAIAITTKRNVLARANHRCEFESLGTGHKCQSNYQIQIDHIVPVALGGTNEENNLRILCRTHNLSAAASQGLTYKKIQHSQKQ